MRTRHDVCYKMQGGKNSLKFLTGAVDRRVVKESREDDWKENQGISRESLWRVTD